MNVDVIQGKWRQIRGKVRERWGKITDDDLDRIEGRADQLVGLLQEKYGYARERAQKEVDAFLKGMNGRLQGAGDTPSLPS